MKKQQDLLAAKLAQEEQQRQEIIDIIKAPRKKKPKTADDILTMIRSKNGNVGNQTAFSNVINDLTTMIDQIVFNQPLYNYEDYQDIAWHLDMLRNRLDWLMERRNEETGL
jgi:hypothetical protein